MTYNTIPEKMLCSLHHWHRSVFRFGNPTLSHKVTP